MGLIDWGVFWTAAGPIVAVVGIVVTVLLTRRKPFSVSGEAIMDTPRKAIRVILTAAAGKVQEVSIVRNTALDTYQTAPDEAINFPSALKSGRS